MAMLGANLAGIKPQESFDPVPPGDYHVTITDSSVGETKTGKPMLKVTFTVADVPYSGRKVFDNFLLGNEIAMSRMKSMAISAQHKSPDFIQDSEELHGLKLIIKVKVTNDPGYPPQNKVTSFKKLEGASVPVPPSQAPVFAPAPILPGQLPPAPKVTPSFSFAAPAPTIQPPAPVAVFAAPQEKTVAVNSPAPAPAKLPWE